MPVKTIFPLLGTIFRLVKTMMVAAMELFTFYYKRQTGFEVMETDLSTNRGSYYLCDNSFFCSGNIFSLREALILSVG